MVVAGGQVIKMPEHHEEQIQVEQIQVEDRESDTPVFEKILNPEKFTVPMLQFFDEVLGGEYVGKPRYNPSIHAENMDHIMNSQKHLR